MIKNSHISKFKEWQADWNKFVYDVLQARLDAEQRMIIDKVQTEKMVAVASGTARGKDYVAACASLCFLYLTPKWNAEGRLIENTKVALTAPTGRQVTNIMTPEIRKLLRNAKILPGRTVANDIRTNYEEWFLTGFKADDNATEAWSGFHASNTMFVVTEATGIAEQTFHAIEGNLQGNSRLLLVFNPNITTGYASKAMQSNRFTRIRLSSLNAENVVKKKIVFPGQVDYEWVKDKVKEWAVPINQMDFNEGEGDFKFEGELYRPNDLFRVKVLGMFPTVSEGMLIPYEWVELANKRWLKLEEEGFQPKGTPLVGVDVAGMGRDSSVIVERYENYVSHFNAHQSGGKADHMHVAGMVAQILNNKREAKVFVDTIGEGAGVYSRLVEQGYGTVQSTKFSEGAKGLSDITGQYEFVNMKAYLYWCVRDWLNPENKNNPALPPNDLLFEECTSLKWSFQSNGKIQMEKKSDLEKRLKRSPDYFDTLANTFYPNYLHNVDEDELLRDFL